MKRIVILLAFITQNAFMKIQINRVNSGFHFEATNEAKVKMKMDASAAGGGSNLGFTPVEALVASLGGCSGIDVISILNKQKQQIDDFQVEIEAVRAQEKIPAVVTDIHLKFILKGNIDEDKLERAIQLSLDKYCTIAKMIGGVAKINYSYAVIH